MVSCSCDGILVVTVALMPCWLTDKKGIFIATAAYAAVLVVFVGASSGE